MLYTISYVKEKWLDIQVLSVRISGVTEISPTPPSAYSSRYRNKLSKV